MEYWDRELERRVWRRVRGESGAYPHLGELITLCRIQCDELKALDPQLYRMERQTLALLTGLVMLSGEAEIRTSRPLPGNRTRRLWRCRERCGRMLEILVALETHDRYGPVFTDLTRQQRVKCARLEQLARIRPDRKYTD